MGAAYAAIPDGNGVIHACYHVNGQGQVDGGANLRLIDPSSSNKDGSACKKDEQALNFNQQGQQGATGATGATGNPGPAWTPTYGIAQVLVQRGTGDPAEWASYSSTLGSPNLRGDTTGGSFRFTCRDSYVTCKVSVKAMVTNGQGAVYPRLLIYKQDYFNPGPEVYCEYADGVTNDAPGYGLVGTSFTPLTLGIGGTLDCPGSTQAYPANGVANSIDVPAGYYDVQATFYFKQQ
jgi:hypothetical protein